MRVVHFCSYYIGSKVYKNLFSKLSEQGVNSDVFVPVRSSEHHKANFLDDDKVYIKYQQGLSILTRVFYLLKLIVVVMTGMKFLNSRKESGSVIHAHTLYADGIPAFICAKLFNKQLVVTLRNTDVNLGFKYFRHYKWLAKLALKFSKQIIFVSPGHKLLFQNYFGHGFDNKLKVIPNGIDDFFIGSTLSHKVTAPATSAIYAGEVTKNKNISRAIQAFSQVNADKDWLFTVVGGSYSEFTNAYAKLDDNVKDKVHFVPRVPKEQLVELYDTASIFIMPSHKETFGLVYIEAISRCLPVVYSKGQGIDGYYSEGEVGYSCRADSVEDIASAIRKTLEKYPNGLTFKRDNLALDYSWASIASLYKNSVYQ